MKGVGCAWGGGRNADGVAIAGCETLLDAPLPPADVLRVPNARPGAHGLSGRGRAPVLVCRPDVAQTTVRWMWAGVRLVR